MAARTPARASGTSAVSGGDRCMGGTVSLFRPLRWEESGATRSDTAGDARPAGPVRGTAALHLVAGPGAGGRPGRHPGRGRGSRAGAPGVRAGHTGAGRAVDPALLPAVRSGRSTADTGVLLRWRLDVGQPGHLGRGLPAAGQLRLLPRG